MVSVNVSDWAARVRTLALTCGFGTELDIMLRDKFVLGLDKRLLEGLFEEDATHKDTTFAKTIEIALAKEASVANCNVKPYNGSTTINPDDVNYLVINTHLGLFAYNVTNICY